MEAIANMTEEEKTAYHLSQVHYNMKVNIMSTIRDLMAKKMHQLLKEVEKRQKVEMSYLHISKSKSPEIVDFSAYVEIMISLPEFHKNLKEIKRRAELII